MAKNRKKVVLGFSGGSDSLVAATLLKSQDYDVRAVHYRFDRLSSGLPVPECLRTRPLEYIERVAHQLDLNLRVEDASGEVAMMIQDAAIEARMASRYFEGNVAFHSDVLLPNLERYRVRTGSDLLATGHRARLVRDFTGAHRAWICRAFETERDQSHLLAKIEIGDSLLLPMGEIPSSMVVKILRELRISDPLADSPRTGDEECIDPAYWGSDAFADRLPRDLKLAGSYRVPAGVTAPREHRGPHAHTIGETIDTADGPVVTTGFDYASRTWSTADVLAARPLEIVARSLRWFGEPPKDLGNARFEAVRARFPRAAPLSVGLFPYLEDWAKAELVERAPGLSPGERIALYAEGQLIGEFVVESLTGIPPLNGAASG